MTGIYIHIPFCIRKCFYCDFNSYDCYHDDVKNQYTNALIKEIKSYGRQNINADSIYIGGGTPTVLNADLIGKILEACFDSFNIAAGSEISMECNPGTTDLAALKKFRSFGINRLSIGLQSFDDEQLKLLGRIHTSSSFVATYYHAKQAGFDNINVDIMFGLPYQSIELWSNTLDGVLELSPSHISCYGLKIEPDTAFVRYVDHLPDQDTDRLMYSLAVKKLCGKPDGKYNHYEISNFAKDRFECKHNLKYWTLEQYIGLGAGAHSFIHNIRRSNVMDVEQYISLEDVVSEQTELTTQDLMSEYMFLQLRLTKGVSAQDFKLKFNLSLNNVYGKVIDKFVRHGLMETTDSGCKLTYRGIDVSNQVFIEFLQ